MGTLEVLYELVLYRWNINFEEIMLDMTNI